MRGRTFQLCFRAEVSPNGIIEFFLDCAFFIFPNTNDFTVFVKEQSQTQTPTEVRQVTYK